MKIPNIFSFKVSNVKIKTKSLLGSIKKLFGLKKDIFQKSEQKIEKTFIHKGDSFSKIPDSITKVDDLTSISLSKIKFYQDDIEKMKNMSVEECLKYKKYLIENNRYL